MIETIYASDLMSEARKNPEKYEGKRYKVVDGSPLGAYTEDHSGPRGRRFKSSHYECEVRGGELMAKGDFVAVYSDTQLQEIKPEPKPVPFIEAIEAFAAGKTILCKCDDRCNYYESGSRLKELKDQNNWGPSAHEILHGTWYIEEDTP